MGRVSRLRKSTEGNCLIAPVGKEASIDAYIEAIEAAKFDGVPDSFYPRDRLDAHGQRVCAYWGPGGNAGDTWTEEEWMVPLRADLVLQLDYDHAEMGEA